MVAVVVVVVVVVTINIVMSCVHYLRMQRRTSVRSGRVRKRGQPHTVESLSSLIEIRRTRLSIPLATSFATFPATTHISTDWTEISDWKGRGGGGRGSGVCNKNSKIFATYVYFLDWVKYLSRDLLATFFFIFPYPVVRGGQFGAGAGAGGLAISFILSV